MKRRRITAIGLSASLVLVVPPMAAARTNLVVQYAYPDVNGVVFERIRQEFNKQYPEIDIRFQSNYKDFEDGLQAVLRGAITGQLPDVTYQALNRVRALSDRRLAVDLAPFIAAEPNWSEMGYGPALLRIGQVQGKQYSLAFQISTPVVYYNAELITKAGGDPEKMPNTWDGLYALAVKIENPAEKVSGFKIDWDTTGNWMWQALVNSYGGTMVTPDEKQVAFDGAAGRAAMNTLARAVTVAKMHDTNQIAARQEFISGRLGIWVHSASLFGQVAREIGDRFHARTSPFPLSAGDESRVPAGGGAVIMLTKDPAKQKAAWEYMKFVTGPAAQTVLANATGYLATNDLLANDANAVAAFVKRSPNYAVSLRQLPYLTSWYAYPGDNGLKITDVVQDDLQTVVNQSMAPDAALKKMAADVQALLPR